LKLKRAEKLYTYYSFFEEKRLSQQAGGTGKLQAALKTKGIGYTSFAGFEKNSIQTSSIFDMDGALLGK